MGIEYQYMYRYVYVLFCKLVLRIRKIESSPTPAVVVYC